MSVYFTFDVEEHFRIEAAVGYECPAALKGDYSSRMEACTRWLLDELAATSAKATFFVVGQIGRSHPQLVRDMAAAGHEVACHSWDHQSVYRLSPVEFRADLRQAVDVLEQAAGMPIAGFRAPTFSMTRDTAWAIDILAEQGMRYDSSIFPVRHDRYGIHNAPRVPFIAKGNERSILELPLLTLKVGSFNLPAAGGGYFRLFPPAIMRAAVCQLGKDSASVPVLYFHPWEFDSTQPRLPLGRAGRWRTYVGIKRTRSRIRRLLERYGSARLIDAVDQLDQSRVELPTFDLAAKTVTA